MSTATTKDRTGMAMPGMAMSGMPTGMTMPGVGVPTTPVGTNWMMVPRCAFKFEKVSGGMKVTCVSDDPMACAMVQNLCTMLQGGMFSCQVTLNGMTVCSYNFTMGMCRCEMMDKGVCFTCTSGDAKCCEMIQSCCDCLATLCNAGCTCCVMMNNTPVCCGTTTR